MRSILESSIAHHAEVVLEKRNAGVLKRWRRQDPETYEEWQLHNRMKELEGPRVPIESSLAPGKVFCFGFRRRIR